MSNNINKDYQKTLSYLKKNHWDLSPLINEAFLIAVDKEDIHHVAYFLKKGATISYHDYAAVDRVLQYENFPILKLFIEHAKSNDNDDSFDLSFKNDLILKYSVQVGNLEIFEYVLDHIENRQLDYTSDNYANFWICIFQRFDFLRAVLQHQTFFGNIIFQTKFLMTYLHFASLEVLDYFVSTGYDINGQENIDHWQNSLFLRACSSLNLPLIQHLCTNFNISLQQSNLFSQNAFDIVFKKACEHTPNNDVINSIFNEEIHFSQRENFQKTLDIMLLLIENGFSLEHIKTENDYEYNVLTHIRSASLKKQLSGNLVTKEDKIVKL